MSMPTEDAVVIDVQASNLALRISLLFKQLLMDRGVELVHQSGGLVVTTKHVEVCLDHVLFDDLCNRIREGAYDPSTCAEGAADERSQRAA